MTTKDTIDAIKQGDRVVYTIGGVEYNATALGPARSGFHAGLKRFNSYLTLIYLNEQGSPVKVNAAPMLGTEHDEEHIIAAADDATRRDLRFAGANDELKGAIYQEKLKLIKDNPTTIGWRVGSVGDRPAPAIDDRRQLALSANAARKQSENFEFPNSSTDAKGLGGGNGALIHGNVGHDQPIEPWTETGDGTVYPVADMAPGAIGNSVVLRAEQARESMRPAPIELKDPFKKSSGDDEDGGDWTKQGDGSNYPGPRAEGATVRKLPSQAEADAIAEQAAAEMAKRREESTDETLENYQKDREESNLSGESIEPGELISAPPPANDSAEQNEAAE